MKKFIQAALAAAAAAVCLTVALAAPTFAQAAPGQARHQGAGRMKKLANALGLTDAQKAQIKPILQNSRQQAQAIKQDTSLTPEAKKEKMNDLRKSTMEQIRAILTPDQIAKLKAMRQQGHRGNKA